MIDRLARDNAALNLRRFAVGRIGCEELEKIFNTMTQDKDFCLRQRGYSHDKAIHEIWWQLSSFCDDLEEELGEAIFERKRIELKESLRLNRKNFARTILFLQTDQEYEWESSGCFSANTLILLLTLGLLNSERPEAEREFWPFLNRSEYQRALKIPKFLSGKA